MIALKTEIKNSMKPPVYNLPKLKSVPSINTQDSVTFNTFGSVLNKLMFSKQSDVTCVSDVSYSSTPTTTFEMKSPNSFV